MMRLLRDHLPERSVLEARQRMNRAIREFFDARGFLEVETAIAVPSPGVELHLFPFETTLVAPDGQKEALYLHTSPEYAMKRMLRRLGSIYQLARVFRNGECSPTHAPEFTMLEYYRAPGHWRDLVEDLRLLLPTLAEAIGGSWRPEGFDVISVSELFVQNGLVDPLETPDLELFRVGLGLRSAPDDTWVDLFHRAFLERIEPNLPPDRLTVVYGYPAVMRALARLDPDDPRRAERFEVYAGSLELGNAYGELVDVVELEAILQADLDERQAAGRMPLRLDRALLRDLDGAPPSAGIALGVDRYLMRCLGLPRIQDGLVFSPIVREAGDGDSDWSPPAKAAR